ncbi:class I SAM-dependent methyltransferase [Acidiphilium sp. PA]|uniref:class I SAM-dependent methyltransferase n=1 Tax=Acidiphilium sp. PA TaxID=2871705 RepID=UPI002242F3FD|nr:class I SAM-dependent methyltransferase [Acidiphilium sp. PA]MCW8308746.1 class I SAM-dependent methyltransferase [Acidiphilium sp. PA]
MDQATRRETWNQRYAIDDYIFGKEPSELLVRHKSLLRAGDTALSVADGEGRNSAYLAQLGMNVTSFDFSDTAIAKAQKLFDERRVSVNMVEHDIETWPWTPNAYDVVVGIFFQFLDPAARSKAFAGIAQTAKPGGRIFLRGYTPKQLEFKTGGPPEVENLYTVDLLLAAFPGFELIHLADQITELNEGPRHTGMSAFVDLVLRKPI